MYILMFLSPSPLSIFSLSHSHSRARALSHSHSLFLTHSHTHTLSLSLSLSLCVSLSAVFAAWSDLCALLPLVSLCSISLSLCFSDVMRSGLTCAHLLPHSNYYDSVLCVQATVRWKLYQNCWMYVCACVSVVCLKMKRYKDFLIISLLVSSHSFFLYFLLNSKFIGNKPPWRRPFLSASIFKPLVILLQFYKMKSPSNTSFFEFLAFRGNL